MFGDYRRLTSTNPDEFWTCGQWMTEKGGGSDVGKLCFIFFVLLSFADTCHEFDALVS